MTIKTKHLASRSAALCIALLAFALSSISHAETAVSLDTQVQDIKAQTLALNRDLFILEEELLFPDNTQVAVFVSMDVGQFFALDAEAHDRRQRSQPLFIYRTPG